MHNVGWLQCAAEVFEWVSDQATASQQQQQQHPLMSRLIASDRFVWDQAKHDNGMTVLRASWVQNIEHVNNERAQINHTTCWQLNTNESYKRVVGTREENSTELGCTTLWGKISEIVRNYYCLRNGMFSVNKSWLGGCRRRRRLLGLYMLGPVVLIDCCQRRFIGMNGASDWWPGHSRAMLTVRVCVCACGEQSEA